MIYADNNNLEIIIVTPENIQNMITNGIIKAPKRFNHQRDRNYKIEMK
jgi:hypothetical protein